MKDKQINNVIKLVIAGMIVGYMSSYMMFEYELSNISVSTNPILLQVITTIPLLVMLAKYLNIKKAIKLDNFSNEEDSVYEKTSNKRFVITSLATLLIIVNFMMFGINFSNKLFSSIDENIEKVVITLLIFTVNCIIGSFLEISNINLIKRVEPNKNVDPTELNYNKKALDTLDEYEMQIVGKASARTISYMAFVYLIIFLIGLLTGQTAIFFICTLGAWAVNHIIYNYQHYMISNNK
ncbi:MAG: DUF3169 family protein [bacterium]